MHIIPTSLPGVLLVEPRVFADARGWFFESYSFARYEQAGLSARFVQDNHSRSEPGILRGLHYQLRYPQGKLVRCVKGAVFDVAVDVRRGSPGFAKWFGVELSAENKRQLYIPPGFAHGYCVPDVPSEVEYKCTDYYHPEDDHGLIWNDPLTHIAWPITTPILSERDARHPPLSPDRADLPDYPG